MVELDTSNLVAAKRIFGQRGIVFPVGVASVSGLQFSGEQSLTFLDTMPGEEKLSQMKGAGFVLIAGPVSDMTLPTVCNLAAHKFPRRSGTEWWFKHATGVVSAGRWLAINVSQCVYSEWETQKNSHRVPTRPANVAELVYALIMLDKICGVRLHDVVLRTATVGLASESHVAGCPSGDEIHIVTLHDSTQAPNVGLATVYDLA